MMKLTDLERDVLFNGLYENYFNEVTVENLEEWGEVYGENGNTICALLDRIVKDCLEAEPNQISGVVSSLSKKGLVTYDEEIVKVTSKGWEEILFLLSSSEEAPEKLIEGDNVARKPMTYEEAFEKLEEELNFEAMSEDERETYLEACYEGVI